MHFVKKLVMSTLVVATSGCFSTHYTPISTKTESIYAFMLSDNAIHVLGEHYDYQISANKTKNAKGLIQLLHSPYYSSIKQIDLIEIKKNVKSNTAQACLDIDFEPTKFTEAQQNDLSDNYQVRVVPKRVYYPTCLENIALVKVENREQLLTKNKFSPPLKTRFVEYKENTHYDSQATKIGLAIAVVAPIYIAGSIIALPFTLFDQH
ncbi:hypothetical protein [Pasteurella sp. PK-2025]|uniref:hypothetical protein n=1 Tax=Pasteurella sp. PK-2025 TaxID=3413133 RepID=UPI003C75B1AC